MRGNVADNPFELRVDCDREDPSAPVAWYQWQPPLPSSMTLRIYAASEAEAQSEGCLSSRIMASTPAPCVLIEVTADE